MWEPLLSVFTGVFAATTTISSVSTIYKECKAFLLNRKIAIIADSGDAAEAYQYLLQYSGYYLESCKRLAIHQQAADTNGFVIAPDYDLTFKFDHFKITAVRLTSSSQHSCFAAPPQGRERLVLLCDDKQTLLKFVEKAKQAYQDHTRPFVKVFRFSNGVSWEPVFQPRLEEGSIYLTKDQLREVRNLELSGKKGILLYGTPGCG